MGRLTSPSSKNLQFGLSTELPLQVVNKTKENNKNNDLIGMHLLDGNLQQKAN